MSRTAFAAACFAAGSLVCAPALASGLQVSPVLVRIMERSSTVWLTNSGGTAMRAQVRVFHWTQDSGRDAYAATEEVLPSPPFVELSGGAKQLVRLVRRSMPGGAGAPCEDAYRIAIDELPNPAAPPDGNGLRYRMSYSVPVFVTSRACRKEEPKLSFALPAAGTLAVANTGLIHAQLADAAIVTPDGRRTPLAKGLVGYVLPGSTINFTLGPRAGLPPQGSALEVTVNGKKVAQPLARTSSGQ
ncbi:fimbrial biogenesis chaperone [Novosphingobium guangzhouense]|uniref:Pili assembly chaperone N-terminal domain-containing protein n=1 Tax=Novosphingobium guangzhouense TaxID=1850347 RepID=A0A2K2G652_9SPHN|nr:fimbria/pilus periplasmic chaperone [Novosphingobium guangzhouense]PNU06516.1 hypothetical protein A8V01_02965 [Novosphingobium guangzhouense]